MAGQLEPGGCLLHLDCCWLAKLEQLRAGRPSARGDVLLILLAPFCLGWNGLWRVWQGACCGYLEDRPEHLGKAPFDPTEVEGDIKQWHSLATPILEFPQILESSHGFLAFSILSFLCCADVRLAFSCHLGGIALSVGVYFSVLVRGCGQCPPVSPPSWTSVPVVTLKWEFLMLLSWKFTWPSVFK